MLTACGASAAVAVGADRGGIGIELEGIEGGSLVGVVGRGFSGKSGYDAKVRLDGDVFAAALVLDHRLVDHVARGEAAAVIWMRSLSAVALCPSRARVTRSASASARRGSPA